MVPLTTWRPRGRCPGPGVDEVDDRLEDAGVGLGEDAVAQVEDVPGRRRPPSRTSRAASLDDGAVRARQAPGRGCPGRTGRPRCAAIRLRPRPATPPVDTDAEGPELAMRSRSSPVPTPKRMVLRWGRRAGRGLVGSGRAKRRTRKVSAPAQESNSWRAGRRRPRPRRAAMSIRRGGRAALTEGGLSVHEGLDHARRSASGPTLDEVARDGKGGAGEAEQGGARGASSDDGEATVSVTWPGRPRGRGGGAVRGHRAAEGLGDHRPAPGATSTPKPIAWKGTTMSENRTAASTP